MPAMKGTEAPLPYIQCFLYLVSFLINVSIFHSTWMDTFCTDLVNSVFCVVRIINFCMHHCVLLQANECYMEKDRDSISVYI